MQLTHTPDKSRIPSQLIAVIKHSYQFGGIAVLEAQELYRVMRLAGVIHIARKRGYLFDTIICKDKLAKYVFKGHKSEQELPERD